MILLQVVVWLLVFAYRGWFLFGYHLSRVKKHKGWLQYINRDKHGWIEERHVGLIRTGGIPFVVRRERWYHRYFKRVGLASEIAVPDEAFDRKYFITTDFPHHLEQVMAMGDLLAALKELSAKGVDEVHATPSKVWCVVGGRDMGMPIEKFEPYMEALMKVAKAAVLSNQVPVAYRVKRRKLWALGFLAMHLALPICVGMWLLGVLDSPIDIIDNGILGIYGVVVAAAVLAGWTLAIVAVFKGTSWLGWVMADFWIWGVVGVVVGCSMWVREADITLEQDTVVHEQPVLTKMCTLHCYLKCGNKCSKNERYIYSGDYSCSPSVREQIRNAYLQKSEVCRYQATYEYEVSVMGWRGNSDEAYRMEVSEPVFDGVKVGGSIQVPVHKGALGLEWVDQREPRP